MPKSVRIGTPRLLLASPTTKDAARALRYAQDNREHLARWEPRREAGYFTLRGWTAMLNQAERDLADGRAVRLILLSADDPTGPVLGWCNLNNFVRGAFQAAYLGYSLDYREIGKGLMQEAVEATVRYAFTELHLHRIMANYMPANERSGNLLRRVGFVTEGCARDYLYVAGRWEDHVMTSLTNPDWTPS